MQRESNPGAPRPERLTKRAEFLRVSGGRRAHTRAFTLQIRPREGARPDVAPRFGLTATKKIGGAVERNRIRRRLRAALRAPGVVGAPGHDYVIVARRETLTVSFAVLCGDLAEALRSGGRAPRPSRGRSIEPAARTTSKLHHDR